MPCELVHGMLHLGNCILWSCRAAIACSVPPVVITQAVQEWQG